MPKIISFGNINPEDLKENPLKAIWQWFNDQDKFVKSTFVITILLIIATPVIVKTILTINQHAAESERKFVMGISTWEGVGHDESAMITAIENLNKPVEQGGIGSYPASFSIWTSPEVNGIHTFPHADLLKKLDDNNITPVIFMETVSAGNISNNTAIANGQLDTFLTNWALGAHDYGKTVILRIDQEMNMGWAPWSTNGNTPQSYVAMWKHMYKVIHPIAPNVKFFWCPDATSGNFSNYFPVADPGVNYVDYIGFDRYIWEPTNYASMDSVYGPAIRALRQLVNGDQSKPSDIPILVGETGIHETNSGRVNWISNGYQAIYSNYPDVKGIIYFNINMRPIDGHPNWTLSAAASAYAALANDPRFQGGFDSAAPTGTIRNASPNPCYMAWNADTCNINIQWDTQNTSNAFINLADGTRVGNGTSGNIQYDLRQEGYPTLNLFADNSGSQTLLQQVYVQVIRQAAPTPTSAPVAYDPYGGHDGSSCDVSWGWTCDLNGTDQALNVHFYVDGPSGTGTYIGSTVANMSRPDLVTAGYCGRTANHGFYFTTPQSLKDGRAHSIYAYGINIGPSGNNPLLTNTPKTITCGTPAPTITPTPTQPPPGELSAQIIPSEDSYVSQGRPVANYNNQKYLISGDDPKKITYLKFNTSSLNGKRLIKATLVLSVGDGKYAASTANFNLKEVLSKVWSEGKVNYSNRPAAGKTIKSFKGAANGKTIEIDLTNYLQAKLGQTFSFFIGTTNSDWITIGSKESDPTKRPYLLIRYN